MKTTYLSKDPYDSMEPWKMLGWLLATQVLIAFVGRSLAPLGILIGEDLTLTKAQIGMLPAALFFGQMIVSIPAGFLADRIQSHKLLLTLSFCIGISFMLMALSPSFYVTLLFIIIAGLGYGTMHPTSNRGIIYWFTTKKRGTAMGIKQMGVTVGSAMAAFILLPLASMWGWRPVLFSACLLLLLAGLLAYRFYSDPPQTGEQKQHGIQSGERLFASLFRLFTNKPLLLMSLGATGLNGSQMILNTYLVLFAYERLGISLILSGFLLVLSEVSGSFGRVGWGIISDRLFQGRRIIILIIIAILTSFTSILVAMLPAGTSFVVMVPITLAFGFCASGFNGIWMNAATELVPREQAGAASGFSIMLGSWGVILGPPLFGFIVDTTGTFSAGWLFLAVIMGGVIVCLLSANLVIKREEVLR